TLPPSTQLERIDAKSTAQLAVYRFPEGCEIQYTPGKPPSFRSESFQVQVPATDALTPDAGRAVTLPEGALELVPGSSWGTFTIACTIPIALVMGIYVTKLRGGKGIVTASLFGAVAVLAAVVVGNWIPGSPLERFFSLIKGQTIFALTAYGF